MFSIFSVRASQRVMMTIQVLFCLLIFQTSFSQEKMEHYFFPEQIMQWNQYYAIKAEALSVVGSFAEAVKVFDDGQKVYREAMRNKIHKALDGLSYRDAHDFIIEQARTRNIIIINEAHHKPIHRVFTESLLSDLYNIGFHYFGLESLTNGWAHVDPMDTALNSRKFPLINSGPYVPEPNYGNMVRSALQDSFYVFPYEETTMADKTPREQGQARNIAAFLKSHPGARIVIHCGYGHAAKCFSAAFNSNLMAGFLKEYTGIDPLTIDQTQLTEDVENEFDMGAAYRVGKPLVFFTGSGAIANDLYLGKKNGDICYDIMVYHPALPYVNGRPRWKSIAGYKEYRPDLSQVKLQYPIMVKAFLKNESNVSAVPVDIIVINHPGEAVPLLLKSGEYKLEISSMQAIADPAYIVVK